MESIIVNREKDAECLIREVFGSDVDLYKKRQHSSDKTLDGLVKYTMDNIFDGVGDVSVYSFGDRYGFIAIDRELDAIRSFGIKKEHRDKKDLFWDSASFLLGNVFYAGVWSDNLRAIRFFERAGGVKHAESNGGIMYKFNFN